MVVEGLFILPIQWGVVDASSKKKKKHGAWQKGRKVVAPKESVVLTHGGPYPVHAPVALRALRALTTRTTRLTSCCDAGVSLLRRSMRVA